MLAMFSARRAVRRFVGPLLLLVACGPVVEDPVFSPIGTGAAAGSTVGVALTELGLTLRQHKTSDLATGRPVRVSLVTHPDGRVESLTDAQAGELIERNVAAHRARKGAVSPRFAGVLEEAVKRTPSQRFQVGVLAKHDTPALPPRLAPATLRNLTKAQRLAAARTRLSELKRQAKPYTDSLATTLRGVGATNVRTSSWLPLAIAEMTASQALALARRADVQVVLDASQTLGDTLSSSTCDVGATTVAGRGVSAVGINVGVLELGLVDGSLPCLNVTASLNTVGISNHATGVAGVIGSTLAGTTGVAPGANIITGSIEYVGVGAALDWMVEQGAQVINMSFATDFGAADETHMELSDVIVDAFVRHVGRLSVVAAGNSGMGGSCIEDVNSPGIAFNALTVGNYDEGGACGDADTMDSQSCFGNPPSLHGDREKPEVAGPGVHIDTLSGPACNTGPSSGTSFATPHVTGGAALLLARDPGLDAWPEALKAILMATAFNNVEGDARLSDKDGAGGIDLAAADDTAAKGRWWAGEVKQADFGSGDTLIVKTVEVKPLTRRFKVALVWDTNPTVLHYSYPALLAPENDFDLQVLKNGGVVASSESFDNTYETIDMADPAPGFYTIVVRRSSGALAGTEPMAVAWGLDEHECVELGSDADLDGLCGNTDNCPDHPNEDQADGDKDGTGEVCDNCPGLSNPGQEDADLDGKGDPCDPDDDNDGCLDGADQHPAESMVPVGTVKGIMCPWSTKPVLGFEGADSDGDGLLNCEDLDDDGDGTLDDDDGCPTAPGGVSCVQLVTCGVQNWWDVCMFGSGCVESLLKIVSVINPDPTREVVFERFEIVGQQLQVAVPVGKTAADVAGTFALGAPSAQYKSSMLTAAGQRLRLEIWSKPTGGTGSRLLAVVGEYDPSTVQVSALGRERVVTIDPPARAGEVLRLGTGWVLGIDPRTPLRDVDADRIPDAFDNCPSVFNPEQQSCAGSRR